MLAPVIRDLGITLAMRHDEEAVRQVFSAQMGKAGPLLDDYPYQCWVSSTGILYVSVPVL